MNRIFIFSLLGITFLSCSKKCDELALENCNSEVIISEEQYSTAPSDQLTINALEINGSCLKINFSAGGCSGDSWDLKLIDSEAILESNPVQRNLILSLKNEEVCQAYITKELTFGIENLQINGDEVQLNLTNSDKSILYQY